MTPEPSHHAPVTVIAGAASSVGRETARHLAAAGHDLVLLDINESGLDDLQSDLRSQPITAVTVQADLTEETQVQRAMATVATHFPAVSHLVNCAGAFVPAQPLHEVSLEAWKLVLHSNLTASFLTMKHCFDLLQRANHAAVVNIASNAARSTATSLGPEYTSAKAAILGLTRHAARDWAPYRIRVNAVAPGPVSGSRLEALEGAEGMKRIADDIPLGRLGEPMDSAKAIHFLLSQDASFITGATLDVNGGIFMG